MDFNPTHSNLLHYSVHNPSGIRPRQNIRCRRGVGGRVARADPGHEHRLPTRRHRIVADRLCALTAWIAGSISGLLVDAIRSTRRCIAAPGRWPRPHPAQSCTGHRAGCTPNHARERLPAGPRIPYHGGLADLAPVPARSFAQAVVAQARLPPKPSGRRASSTHRTHGGSVCRRGPDAAG